MRTVLITGTSAGFGLLTAVELAKRGWRVIATMRNLERKGPLEAALAQSGAAHNVDIVQLDVTDPASIARGVAETLALTEGFLDAVVHNAGVAAGGAFEDIPEAELRRVIDTNLFGIMGLTRELLPTFRKQRSGRIVVVSSKSGLTGQPGNSIYVASKWAVEGWAESLAFEVESVRHRGGLGRAGRTSPTSGKPRPATASKTAPTALTLSICSVPSTRTSPRAVAIRKRCGASPTCWRRRGRASATRSAARRASCISRAGNFRRGCCGADLKRIWACGGCACSLIATAAQALGSIGCGGLKSRQIPCKYCQPPYRSR